MNLLKTSMDICAHVYVCVCVCVPSWCSCWHVIFTKQWQRLFLTKIWTGSSESSFWIGLTIGLCPLPPESCWVSLVKNLPHLLSDQIPFASPLTSDYAPYLGQIPHLPPSMPPWPAFSKNPMNISLVKNPLDPWCFLLVIFSSLSPSLLLSYETLKPSPSTMSWIKTPDAIRP